jgi:hypothetical protein
MGIPRRRNVGMGALEYYQNFFCLSELLPLGIGLGKVSMKDELSI